MIYDIKALKLRVSKHLKPLRYKHTLGVMTFAEKLAEIHDVERGHVQVAALLHDYCKYESDDDILKSLNTENITIHPVIKTTPNLGHGIMSAIKAKEEFGIKNKDILNAISHHTFGNVKMSKIEKIIYLADSLEENRVYDGIEEFRVLAYKNLDAALLAVSQNTMTYELSRGHMIHENTLFMRNALLEDL